MTLSNTARRSDRPRKGRRLILLLLTAAVLLALVLGAVQLVVSAQARRVSEQINRQALAVAARAEEGAGRFQQFLDQGSGGRHVLDGPSLTRYLERRYGSRVPRSVRAWKITLVDDLIRVDGVVDLESYLREMGLEQPPALSALQGQEIPFRFQGRFRGVQGVGLLEVLEVSLFGLPLPLELVARVGGSAAGSGGSVMIQPFSLPDGIRQAAIEGDRMVIHGPDS